MSRPASESVGAVKRTRTVSSCADSVEPVCLRPELAPKIPSPLAHNATNTTNAAAAAAAAAAVAATAHLIKRSLSNGAAPRPRKRARPVIEHPSAPLHHPTLPFPHPLSAVPASAPACIPPFFPHIHTVHAHYPHNYPTYHHHPNASDRIAQLNQYPSHNVTSEARRRHYHLPEHNPSIPITSIPITSIPITSIPITSIPIASIPITPVNPLHSTFNPHARDENHSDQPSKPPHQTAPSQRQQQQTADDLGARFRFNLMHHLAVDPPPSSRRLPIPKSTRNHVRRDRDHNRPHVPSQPDQRKQHYTLPYEDDEEGHLIYKLGEGLHPSSDFPNGRYKILSELGEGTFGKVVECWDRREGRRVAIKVVRSVNKYREAARLEIDVLLHLNMHDLEGFYHCVKLNSWFDYRSHVCMVFEKLGPSLYEQLRRNRFRPFPLDQVREYAFQLLESVNFVHSLTLIHTDLKPENILLIDAKHSNGIKLIDFGSATFESQHHSAVISTRHYRAPEVILGLGWTYPCDLWSIGCILVELYTGQALFQTHENLEHLAMMIRVLGPIPDSMVRRAHGSGQKYFLRVKGGRSLNWPGGASSKASIRSVRRVQSLKDIIRGPGCHSSFFDLVRSLLTFDPDMRCTSAEALRHPFFRESPHESDPPLTTPTLSSGSSACGSHGANRGRKKTVKGRPKAAFQSGSRHDAPLQSAASGRIDDDGEETATEIPAGAEPSDHTIVAPAISPERRPPNVNVL